MNKSMRKVLIVGLITELDLCASLEQEEKEDDTFLIKAQPIYDEPLFFNEKKKLGKGGRARKRSEFNKRKK